MILLFLKNIVLSIICLATLIACQGRAIITSNIATPSFAGASGVTDNKDGTYTLSWNAAQNTKEVSYQIFASNSSETVPIATVNNATTWVSGLLAFQDNICFVVRAVAKNLQDKNFIQACTNHTKYIFAGLSTITNNNDGTFTLNWSAVPYTATTYSIYKRDEINGTYDFETPTISSLAEASWQSDIISTQVSQCFLVRANSTLQVFIDNNTNEICTQHTQVLFASIDSLTAIATDNNTAMLNWTPSYVSSGGYKVSYKQGSIAPLSCDTDTIITSNNILGASAIINNLSANTQYSARVCAVNSDTAPNTSTGTTVSFNTLNVVTTEVSSAVASAGSNSAINISWNVAQNDTPTFKISYASGTAAPILCTLGTIVSPSQIVGNTASITGLVANTTYTFRICTVNSIGASSTGITTTATTIQAAPSNLSATGGANLATLSWSTLTGATNYAIYYSTTTPITKTATRVVVAAPSTQITSLALNTTYYFNIAVIVGTIESDLSTTEANATTFPAPPSAPTLDYLSFPYLGGIKLHFNTVAGAASYNTYYKTSAGVTTSDSSVLGVSNEQVITVSQHIGTYYVTISSIDSYGQESSLSNEVSLAIRDFITVPQNLSSYTSLSSSYLKDVYVSGSNIYVGSLTGGLSLSTNGGASWTTKTPAQKGVENNGVYSAYAIGSNIYLATPSGFSISTNNGATWTNKNTAEGLATPTTNAAYAIANNIYVATAAGVSISTDAGITWANKTMTDSLGSNTVQGIYATTSSNIYAATTGGLSISTNGGTTWTNKTTAQSLGSNTVQGVYAFGSNIYAATLGGLSISTDDGTTWVNKTTTDSLGSNDVKHAYAVGNNIYASTLGGVSISIDGGTTWVNKTTAAGLGNNDIRKVYVSGGNIYAATYGGGLSISSDGGTTWTTKVPLYETGSDNNYGVFASGDSVYVASSAGLSISTDRGYTWVKKTSSSGLASSDVRKVYASGTNIYAATAGGLSISTDSGATWVNKTTSDSLGSNTVQGVYAVGSNIYAATTGGLSISTNSGTTWLNQTSANGLGNTNIYAVSASVSTIYAATVGGGLSISTNGGATWANKTTTDSLGSNSVWGIYASGNNIYASTNAGFSISTDAGTTWVNKTTVDGIGNNVVYNSFVYNNTIYLTANTGGVCISTNGGTTWIKKNTSYGTGGAMKDVYVSNGIIYSLTVSKGLAASGL